MSLEARGDGGQRLVPADAFELSLALAPDAPQRMENALVRIRAIEVARDLGAERAARGRMQRIARDFHRAAVLDCRHKNLETYAPSIA